MRFLLSTLLCLALGSVPARAATSTLLSDANPEPDIANYIVEIRDVECAVHPVRDRRKGHLMDAVKRDARHDLHVSGHGRQHRRSAQRLLCGRVRRRGPDAHA